MPSPLDEPLPEDTSAGSTPNIKTPYPGSPAPVQPQSTPPPPPATPPPSIPTVPADSIQPPPQSGQPPFSSQPPSSPVVNQPLEEPIEEKGGSSFLKWFLIILIILILVGGGIYIYLRFFRQTSSAPSNTVPLPGPVSTGGEESTGVSSIDNIQEGTTSTTSDTTTLDTPAKRDTQRKTDLKAVKDALGQYFSENNSYPKAAVTLQTNEKGSILETSLSPKYISKLPVDPQDPLFYYGYKSDGQTLELSAVLEVTTDPEGTTSGLKTLYILKND